MSAGFGRIAFLVIEGIEGRQFIIVVQEILWNLPTSEYMPYKLFHFMKTMPKRVMHNY